VGELRQEKCEKRNVITKNRREEEKKRREEKCEEREREREREREILFAEVGGWVGLLPWRST
jgi:hypothetical protein